MATARTAATPDDTGSLPVVGMAEVEPGDTADVVAGPTAPLVVVVVLDALVVVVGLVVVGLVVVGADVALVVVGAVEVVVDAAVVVVAAVVAVVVGGGSCDAQVWLRLNLGSLLRAASAVRSRPIAHFQRAACHRLTCTRTRGRRSADRSR